MRETGTPINVRAAVALVGILMLSSALAGAWISGQLHHDPPAPVPVPPPDTTPERVVPEQSLTLADVRDAIASVDVRDDGTVFHLYPTATVMAYYSGRTVFHLWKQERGDLMIAVEGHDVICMNCPGFEGLERMRPLFALEAPAAKGLTQSIHDWLFPPLAPKPTPKKPDDVVPTSDLRLMTKQGLRFATLGLTSSGDPAIAMTDRQRRVQLVWVQRAQTLDEDWQELAAFDSGGALRVSLQLRPRKTPDLVLYDGHYIPYAFDTKSSKLVKFGEGTNEWLRPIETASTRPVVLTDVRHQRLWKAP